MLEINNKAHIILFENPANFCLQLFIKQPIVKKGNAIKNTLIIVCEPSILIKSKNKGIFITTEYEVSRHPKANRIIEIIKIGNILPLNNLYINVKIITEYIKAGKYQN